MVKKVNASITVEATFLFPIIFFIILTVLYCSLYLYDLSVIQSKLDESILKFQLMIRQPMDFTERKVDYNGMRERSILYKFGGRYEKEKEKIVQELMDELSQHLRITCVEKISFERGIDACLGEIKAEVNLHFLPVISYLWSSDYKVSGSVKTHDPTEFIRRYDALHSVVCDINRYEQIKKRIQEILDKVGE